MKWGKSRSNKKEICYCAHRLYAYKTFIHCNNECLQQAYDLQPQFAEIIPATIILWRTKRGQIK